MIINYFTDVIFTLSIIYYNIIGLVRTNIVIMSFNSDKIILRESVKLYSSIFDVPLNLNNKNNTSTIQNERNKSISI